MLPHGGPVSLGSFSPDDSHVVTCSRAGYARVWDVASGLPVSERFRHETEVIYARFDTTGTHVFTGSKDGMIKKWPLPQTTAADRLWLPDLAEIVARRSINDAWKSVTLDLVTIGRGKLRLREWRRSQRDPPTLLKAYLIE